MVSSNCKWTTSWRQHAEEINEKKNRLSKVILSWTTEIFIIDDNNFMLREQPARSAGCLCLTTCWVLFISLLSNSAIWDQARRGTLTFTGISRKVVGKKRARDNPERKYGIWSIHCFLALQLTLTNRHAWPLVPFFQREKRIILKLGLQWLGGAFSKLLLLKGGEGGFIWNCFFWKGKVLIHHAFLKITAPRWDAINNRSLNIIHSEAKEEISRVNI